MSQSTKPRLDSLDALRGFDLFVLVALGPMVLQFVQSCGSDSLSGLTAVFTHKDWEGFSPWDLIMPLFVFMSGASIPFALGRMKREGLYGAFGKRLLKRVLLLWLFGMVVQGNLLSFDSQRIYLYSNTLQSIATGYLVASLLFMFTTWRTQVAAVVVCLLTYWGAMEFITVDGFGGGDYTPAHNLAEWIDVQVLGRFRDGAVAAADGSVVFAPWYHYTWILSSINFGATAVTGLLAGQIARYGENRRLLLYFGGGALMVCAGWLWNIQMPVIKTIWTSSMVLVSSGYCFLLMGLFYWFYDIRKYRFGLSFLKVYGMNSIAAYMLSECINFRGAAHSVLYGFEQFIPSFYPFMLTLAQVGIIFFILRTMNRQGIYLKV